MNNFVLADTFTKRLVSDRRFASLRAAKTSLTAMRKRAQKRLDRRPDDLHFLREVARVTFNVEAMTLERYNAEFRTTKKVRSLMNPDVEIEIDINTPACCDPSTETYWSM